MSCQWGITRASRPRHIPSIPNISQAVTARLRARRTSPHSFSTEIPPRILQNLLHPAQLPAGRWLVPGYVHAGLKPEVGVWHRGHNPPLGFTAGVFLCRRAVRRHRAEDYSALSGNDLMLSALTYGGRGLRTKELYDVKSDDEDEDDWRDRGWGRVTKASWMNDEDPNTITNSRKYHYIRTVHHKGVTAPSTHFPTSHGLPLGRENVLMTRGMAAVRFIICKGSPNRV
ncbi:hypothetical protein EDB89DRAFT_1900606 [Lactarius sanguifluus]|nr:hypothetical protein EDB89DRAFT_1900606 [Lactarius sanguifluus]